MTLYGILFTAAAWAVCFFDIFESWKGHSLAYAFYAFSIWAYTALDAIDGKQARRTNSASPLGELFDHGTASPYAGLALAGCDSINLFLVSFILRTIFQFPLNRLFYSMTVFGMATFFMSTWEEYYTGVLFLGLVSGPVEGAITLIACSLLSAFYGAHRYFILVGPSFWTARKQLVASVCVAMLIGSGMLFSARNVLKSGKLSVALPRVWPYFGFLVLSLVWPSLLPTDLHTATFFKYMIMLNGIVFAHSVTLIILAHLTRSPFPTHHKMYLVYLFAAILSYSKPAYALQIIQTSLLIAVAMQAHFVCSVVGEICGYLGISCFSLPLPAAVSSTKQQKKA